MDTTLLIPYELIIYYSHKAEYLKNNGFGN